MMFAAKEILSSLVPTCSTEMRLNKALRTAPVSGGPAAPAMLPSHQFITLVNLRAKADLKQGAFR
jgi:hypothetical protein